MNGYSEVIKNAKLLKEEFGKELTTYETLKIAAHVNLAECIRSGLLPSDKDEPAFLEALAMALGWPEKRQRYTFRSIAESLSSVAGALGEIAEKE